MRSIYFVNGVIMLYGIDSEWHYIIRCFFALQSPIMPHLSKVCTPNFTMELDVTRVFIGRSRGVLVHAPPTGPNSFIFAYIFTEKCPRWRPKSPPKWVHAPLQKILDPALVLLIYLFIISVLPISC